MAERTTPAVGSGPADEPQVIRARLSRNAGRYVVGGLACASVAWLLLGPHVSPAVTAGTLFLSGMFALLFLFAEFLTLEQLARRVRCVEIRPEGFTVYRQTRAQKFAWSDIVGEFRVEQREARPCVAFEHWASDAAAPTGRAAAQTTEVLADDLQLSVPALAERLNARLRTARAAAQADPRSSG